MSLKPHAIAPAKVAIVGAGAIGLWIGVHLARAGCTMSALARGATLQALRSQGLRLVSGAELPHQAAVQASDRAEALGVQDLVVISVKAPAMHDIAAAIGPLIGPNTILLTAMNGVPWWFFEGFGGEQAGRPLQSIDPGGRIARAIPARQVMGAVVHASCSVPEPGLARHHFGNRLVLGEPAGGRSERLQALVALLARAGFEAEASDCIQRDIWFKLWGNMTVNPISALTGATTDLIMDDDLLRHAISGMMIEAREIGARIGAPITLDPEDRHVVTRQLGRFKTSMLQDVEAGKALELDALLTVVHELGLRTGVATPLIDALLGLARLQARIKGLYPWPASTTGPGPGAA
jgi:2-dehydropantoate 2-reductase